MSKARGMAVPIADGRLLRILTETVDAKRVVEIGTYRGYSWLCLALRKTGGKLTTYEIDARTAAVARENFKRAGVDQIITLVVGDAHQEVTKLEGPITPLAMSWDWKPLMKTTCMATSIGSVRIKRRSKTACFVCVIPMAKHGCSSTTSPAVKPCDHENDVCCQGELKEAIHKLKANSFNLPAFLWRGILNG